jgi:uncharacterized protein YukE
MNELEKLRVLIPHWIEHNEEHAEEFRRWAKKAGDASNEILKAVQEMAQVNAALSSALEKLGGSMHHEHFQ